VKDASGTEVARYEYDGLNRRIVEQVGTLIDPAAASAAKRDMFYSMDWQVLEERVRGLDGMVSSVADAQYVWSRVYVDAMVLRDRNADGDGSTGSGGLEERIYALHDANWNTTALIVASGVPGASAGDVLQRFVYTPFGEVDVRNADWSTAVGSAAAWQHLFQGLKFSDVTGLAYVRNRDYSASLGRFIELDPIGFDAGDNNWYRFVGNGPTGKTDPSGLCQRKICEDEAGKIFVQRQIFCTAVIIGGLCFTPLGGGAVFGFIACKAWAFHTFLARLEECKKLFPPCESLAPPPPQPPLV
jgi:RHS repeat-associated protein